MKKVGKIFIKLEKKINMNIKKKKLKLEMMKVIYLKIEIFSKRKLLIKEKKI